MEVIDCNVALYAFSQSPLRNDAQRLLATSQQLVAPDLFFGECANVLARLVRVRKMSGRDARKALAAIRALVKVTTATGPLVERALDLALAINHGVFDCLYLEVARQHGARLVTADDRLVAKLQDTPDAGLAVHLADWLPQAAR